MSFARSLGGALGVATSGHHHDVPAGRRIRRAGGTLDLGALNAHGIQAMAQLARLQQAGIGAAYRSALTGCFLLSGVVMTVAFILVLGLPERMLRDEIEEGAAR